jgi:hypothetical protein
MRRCLTTLCFVALAVSAAVAQGKKNVPPPPKPTDDGPSLEVTMKFVQDKLNAIGPVSFANYGHDNSTGNDWTNQLKIELTKVVADPSTCRINYHEKLERDRAVLSDQDLWYSLKGVEDMAVIPMEQAQKEIDTAAGHPTYSAKVDPPIFVLKVRRTDIKGTNNFSFFDEQLASRVAEAMVRAVELCSSGSKPDPAADGRGLEATMKFIQDKLNAVGPVNFVAYLHDNVVGNDWTHQYKFEVTKVVADPTACRVGSHAKIEKDGKVDKEGDIVFLLKNDKEISVLPGEQAIKEAATAQGHTSWSAKVDPSFFVLRVRRTDKVISDFSFFDEQMANRVAKAMVEAVELCGDGSKDVPPPPKPPDERPSVEVASPNGGSARQGRGAIGVEFSTEAISGGGLLLTKVLPGGPADQGGLRKGDVLLTVGKEPISTPIDTLSLIAKQKPGSNISITFRRSASDPSGATRSSGADDKDETLETHVTVADSAKLYPSATPPPPKPGDEGTSLVDTMKFIEDKLNGVGPVNYAVYTHDNIAGKDYAEQSKIEVTKAASYPDRCLVTFRFKRERNGKVDEDHDTYFSLKEVEDAAVMPMEQFLKEYYAAQGHPSWSARVDPPVFALKARGSARQPFWFFFFDEQLANRVAKAMVHAVELCGGSKPEPF